MHLCSNESYPCLAFLLRVASILLSSPVESLKKPCHQPLHFSFACQTRLSVYDVINACSSHKLRHTFLNRVNVSEEEGRSVISPDISLILKPKRETLHVCTDVFNVEINTVGKQTDVCEDVISDDIRLRLCYKWGGKTDGKYWKEKGGNSIKNGLRHRKRNCNRPQEIGGILLDVKWLKAVGLFTTYLR